MAKVCDIQDCNEEIADWQQYCPKHYAQVQQQKQESAIKQPQAQQPVQTQQPVQETGTPQPEPKPQMIDVEEKQTVTEPPKMLPLVKLEGKERLIVKQTALKCAVEFLQQTPVEYNNYDEMVGQLRRLVVDMYRIVVEENERTNNENIEY